MADNMIEKVELLYSPNSNAAYQALKELETESAETSSVYAYMDRFADMIDSDNSYIRTRGLILIAVNAKWDIDYKIDEMIDKYLKHITDVKPITARQCIKMLPIIAKHKQELKKDIICALQKADISIYADSMQQLVQKDIKKSIKTIENENT